MSIRLIVEVLDHAPADLTSQERLVLVVLAEGARDHTRTCWPGMDLLAHRTGLDASNVRRALDRLTRRGYALRVPLGTDKHGRPVYAYRGHATAYRVPELERRALPHAFTPEKGARCDTERRAQSDLKARDVRTPSPQEPSGTLIRAREADDGTCAAIVDALRETTSATVDKTWAAKVARQILDNATGRVAHPARYCAEAIRRDRDPRRFLPTPTPPPLRDVLANLYPPEGKAS